MSRLQASFARLQGEGRKALIPYIMTGDPHRGVTVPLMHAMVHAGANAIELGAPFSDPMADGPVIQAAAERALENGITPEDVFECVREFRRLDDVTPVIVMGYLNLIEAAGYEGFARRASEAGVDGIITVDMPPEEADDYVAALRGASLDPVFLVAPTTSDERIKLIGRAASGFVYYVSLKGVTGAANLNVDEVANRVKRIRRFIDLPIGVGFGINDAEAARRVSACSDAVVVGSAIVKRMVAHKDDGDHCNENIIRDVTALLGEMRTAMDADQGSARNESIRTA